MFDDEFRRRIDRIAGRTSAPNADIHDFGAVLISALTRCEADPILIAEVARVGVVAVRRGARPSGFSLPASSCVHTWAAECAPDIRTGQQSPGGKLALHALRECARLLTIVISDPEGLAALGLTHRVVLLATTGPLTGDAADAVRPLRQALTTPGQPSTLHARPVCPTCG